MMGSLLRIWALLLLAGAGLCLPGAVAAQAERPPARVPAGTAASGPQGDASGRPGTDEDEQAVTLDSDGMTLRTPQGGLTLNLGGRLHFDAGGGEGQGQGLEEASLWRARPRRARLEFEARIDRAWAVTSQLDFADRDSPIKDLTIGYAGFPRLAVVAGNFEEPLGFEELTSSNDIALMERSLANALAPGRSTGLGLGLHGERWTATAGLFGGNINEGVARGGIAVTSRVTYAPLLEPDRVLHLGLSGSYRALDRSGFEISTTAESRVYDVSLIGFDALRDARSVSRLGLEMASFHGPLRIQGEALLARVEREERSSPTFYGGYVLASYMLTGQRQIYQLVPDERGRDLSYAVFGGIELEDASRVSRGGIGAWEIAARYSLLDLDGAEVDGGRAQTLAAGVNWYPDENVRVMANYIHAVRHGRGESHRADVDIVQIRLQVAY